MSQKSIYTLIDKSAAAHDSEAAMQFAQAALNAATALDIIAKV